MEHQKKTSIGFIPAHLGSKRLPKKVLLPWGGMSILQRVYNQATASDLDKVIVVTDSLEIQQHVTDFGGNCLLSGSYPNGTQRCVHTYINEQFTYDILVNIQADEPFISPDDINALIQTLENNSKPSIATLAVQSNDTNEYVDNNVVKIAVDSNNKALYFSRSPIPFFRDSNKHISFIKHKGVYAFDHLLIHKISSLSPSPLEKIENLEQLTWMYHGLEIVVTITKHDSIGIDTLSDYQSAQKSIL